LATETRTNGGAPGLPPPTGARFGDELASSQALDFETVVRVLRRRRWLIVLCFLLVTGATVGYDLTQTKKYSATATLLFRDPGFDQKFFGAPVLAPNVDPEREQETNVGLVSLETVAARTAAVLGPTLGARVSGEVHVSSPGNADLAEITATDPNPRAAAQIATTYAAQYVIFRRDADRSKVLDAQGVIQRRIASLPPSQRNGPTGRALATQASQLEVLADLQTGNAELVQSATVPSSPSSPTPKQDGIIAGIVGLLLGFGLAVIFERLDRRLNDPEELEAAFRMPLLGLIPQSPALAYQKRRRAEGGFHLPPAEIEAFRLLRARLRYFDVDREIKVVLITSAAPNDGKTTVATHLAAAAATSGTRVLLLEGDLRRPTLARRLRTRPDSGLMDVLTADSLQSALRDTASFISTEEVNGVGTGFHVVTAGDIPPNPAAVLESGKMANFIELARLTYDLVVIDSTPLPVVSDAIPLLSLVDGVLVVGRVGVTTRIAGKRLADQLTALRAPTLGLAANALDPRAWGYYGNQYDYIPAPVTVADDEWPEEDDVLADEGEPGGEEPEPTEVS
jgi:tyrosine-protein kinase